MPASILVLVGSLRHDSSNRMLAEALRDHAGEETSVTLFDGLDELPFYNEDIDTAKTVPTTADRLRAAIAEAGAVLIITPEYNGTIPAVIKNAIDWGSRPYGRSALSGKPVAVIGGAFGRCGGQRAHHETRHALTIAGAEPIDEISLSIPDSATRFAATHPREDAEITAELTHILRALAPENSNADRQAAGSIGVA